MARRPVVPRVYRARVQRGARANPHLRAFNARVRQAVKNMGETKFQTDRYTGNLTTAGAITNIHKIAQGDANGQRDGLVINNKSIELRYKVNNVGASQAVARVILFKWYSDSAQAPTVGQILQDDNGVGDPDITSVYNLVYKDKYKILHDRIHVFGRDFSAGTTTASDNINHVVHKTIRLKGTMMYKDDLATSYERGALMLLLIGDSANVQYIWNSLYKYTD